MRVWNLENKAGKPVANQFIIEDGLETYFQSYDKIIAKKDFLLYDMRGMKGQIVLDIEFWDWSKTTGQYRNIFLGETKKETEKKIKEGLYWLANLNER